MKKYYKNIYYIFFNKDNIYLTSFYYKIIRINFKLKVNY